ncbi:MAG: GAF domain-containing protein [Chloroflexi bacterium]|nr:GAF domain-containing protein [Chloroflexota bacterium]
MNQPISESLKSFTNIRLSSGAVGRGLVVLLVADGLLLLFFGQPLVMDAALLPLWLGGLFSFVLADFGSKLRERLLLTGYLNFLYLLSWFTLGTLPTLALILIGVSLAALLRVGWGPRLGLGKVSKTFAWRLALLQAAWFSGALLVVAAVYHLLGGTLPLDSHELVATAAALLAAFGVPQVLALWLAGDSGLAPVWKAPRAVFFLEIFLLVLAPALALTLPSAGTLFVVIVLTLLGVQALRDIQMLDMRWQLTQRVEQLSLLAQMAQQVTTTLVLDDLLLSIYHEVQRLLPSTRFMAALYDEETQTLDFPLTMVNGQRVERVTRPLADTPTDYVVHSGRSLYLRADNDVLRQKLHIALPPPGENRSVYLGVPLLAGDRTIGALALEHDDDPNALDTHAQMVLEMVAGQVGVAIRNALLYERSTKMTNALALMNTSVQHIMFNLDSAKGLETACATAMAVSGAQKSAIYVLDMAHKTRMRLAQQHNLPAAYVQAFAEQPYEPEHYAAGAYVVPDTREDARMAEAGRLGQFQASAQIPLRSSSALVGCLIVYYERVHYFQQHELDLLKTLSYQITAALDNAELLKALEIYASEQAQLVYLSRMSTASLELDKVLAGVAALLEQMVSIDHVRVAVLVAGRERLQLFDTGGSRLNVRNLALHALPEVQALFSGAQPLLPQIFQHSAGVTSPELRALMQENGESTLALVPLTVNGNVLGAMLLGSRTPREFSDSEIRLIEMAMNQVAAQIYNARLFATTEEDLKRRMEQLSLLEDIAQEITGALDLNKLISFVLQAAISATQADVATLGLLTEGERFWFIVRERSADGQWQEHYQTSMAQNGISGRVAHTGQTALVVDNQLDPDYIVPSKTRVYRSSLVVPLRKEERVMGVLNVESEEINFFTPQQSSFLNNLAGHAVISIDNARLLQERQREIETLQRLR